MARMQEKSRSKRPKRSFTDEFKAGAVRLVLDEGKTVAQVARDLDLTATCLRLWVEQARADRSNGKTGLTTEEREVLRRLRKEVRELRMEREILKNFRAWRASCSPEAPATLFLLSDTHLGAENLKAKQPFTKADTTDAETPFKYGTTGPGSWNDPQRALSFLRDFLARHVGASREPIVLMQHYGFDGFSLNDWNWWTPKQRRALYELLKDFNVAAFFHGHNHHAEHYRWPDPKRHAADRDFFFDGKPPANAPQYDVVSCGNVCWVIRVRGDQLIGANFKGPDWNADPAAVFVNSLKP